MTPGTGTESGSGARAASLSVVPAPGAAAVGAVRGSGRGDRPGWWLGVSLAALAVLSGSAAVVSYAAQLQMVRAAKGGVAVSVLEAGIPDVAALVFATLGIALALHGSRAVRARVLNLAAVGTSVCMNVLAAGPGWRDLVIWVMPPAAYALASDTAIGVVRARALARRHDLARALADDRGPLAQAAGLLLWLLRLALAPASTLSGFREWVVEELPVAPGRLAPGAAPEPAAIAATTGTGERRGLAGDGSGLAVRPGTKTARFLRLVAERYGPLAGLPLSDVSRVSSELAPAADLHPGAARSALRRHVQAARAADVRPCPAGDTAGPARPIENGSSR